MSLRRRGGYGRYEGKGEAGPGALTQRTSQRPLVLIGFDFEGPPQDVKGTWLLATAVSVCSICMQYLYQIPCALAGGGACVGVAVGVGGWGTVTDLIADQEPMLSVASFTPRTMYP